MMKLDAHTKIGQILRHHPDALEAIVSISPKFNKLRNPVLRKMVASQATLAMACKIGDCTLDDFFHKLEPLGFTKGDLTQPEDLAPTAEKQSFMSDLNQAQTLDLDVRAMLEAGNDPFQLIIGTLNDLQDGHTLRLINSFEPLPLIQIVQKKGFETFTQRVGADVVHTYIHKKSGDDLAPETPVSNSADFAVRLDEFDGKLRQIDVRELPMPQPMHVILEELSNLPAGQALFVQHKRIPIFLLPELDGMGYQYTIREWSADQVDLLIYRV